MVYIFIGVAIIVWSLIIWIMTCNEKAYRQRQIIIHKICPGNFYKRRLAFYDVSHEKHMWALICFQNPNDLYRAQRVKSIIQGESQ